MTASTDRTAFRETVAAIAQKAKEKLPECNGRVEKAVALVLQGDVELLDDGTAQVFSQSNGVTSYHLVGGVCDCHDYERAPHHFCKHRLAAAIARRVGELLPQVPEIVEPWSDNDPEPEAPEAPEAPTPSAPLPEAPASCNVFVMIGGHKVQVTLRDADEHRMLARLQTLLAQYPVETPAAQADNTTPQCPTHGAMKASTKGKGWFCPHKLADGSWCPSKGT